MTKPIDSAVSGDDKPTLEIEITEEMIEAGVNSLRQSGRLSFEVDGLDQILVENLLRQALSRGAGYGTNGRLS